MKMVSLVELNVGYGLQAPNIHYLQHVGHLNRHVTALL